jgi:hypothetical protein
LPTVADKDTAALSYGHVPSRYRRRTWADTRQPMWCTGPELIPASSRTTMPNVNGDLGRTGQARDICGMRPAPAIKTTASSLVRHGALAGAAVACKTGCPVFGPRSEPYL